MQYEIARLTCNIWKFCRPTVSALLHNMSTLGIRLKRVAELPPHKLLPDEQCLPIKIPLRQWRRGIFARKRRESAVLPPAPRERRDESSQQDEERVTDVQERRHALFS